MIKEAIEKVVRKEDLTYEEANTVMLEIMKGKPVPHRTQHSSLHYPLSPHAPRQSMRFQVALKQCEALLYLSSILGWK